MLTRIICLGHFRWMSVTVDNYTELVRIGCQTMPNSLKTRSQQVNTQEKGVQYPRAFQKRQTLKKKSGFVDRGYNTSKKWLAFFFAREKYLRYPSAWKMGKYSHFSYIFTNYSPFLNYKIMGLRQLITDNKDLSLVQNSFVYFNVLGSRVSSEYREIAFFSFF
jgi:hypothetical protein